jgi:hypothetical protein
MAGFERDGWAMGHCDNESRRFVDQVYQRADAFLFGRRTYEFFRRLLVVVGQGTRLFPPSTRTSRLTWSNRELSRRA